ncbi:hypothetical protein L345_06305, partial [Ophiophagus hannah]
MVLSPRTEVGRLQTWDEMSVSSGYPKEIAVKSTLRSLVAVTGESTWLQKVLMYLDFTIKSLHRDGEIVAFQMLLKYITPEMTTLLTGAAIQQLANKCVECGIGASFQCQLIHQDHICTDDSDKLSKIILP